MVRAGTPDPHILGNIFWENTIRLDMHPTDKWDAIAQMVDILVEERQVPPSQRDNILHTALEREHKGSTAMGHATAIPHAPIPNLPAVIGAVGICPAGIDFDAPDGKAVYFIFLLLTPQQNYRSYIPVLAEIAGLMRTSTTQQGLLDCQTPSEAAAHFRAYKAV
jgi:PTS system fructose-specific IIC component/PTS system nitrogen regulatory IIA component